MKIQYSTANRLLPSGRDLVGESDVSTSMDADVTGARFARLPELVRLAGTLELAVAGSATPDQLRYAA